METIELKGDIFNLLEKVNDINILKGIKILLTKQIETPKVVDFWDELPTHVKNGIEEGLRESELGLTIPHEEVMKKITEK